VKDRCRVSDIFFGFIFDYGVAIRVCKCICAVSTNAEGGKKIDIIGCPRNSFKNWYRNVSEHM